MLYFVCLSTEPSETKTDNMLLFRYPFTLPSRVVKQYTLPLTERSFLFTLSSPKDEWLIALRQFCYGFFVDFAEDLTVIDTGEIIVEYLLALIIPVIADNIFLYEVGLEVSRKFPRIHEFLPRFFQILGDILRRLENVGVAVYRSKVVPSEAF